MSDTKERPRDLQALLAASPEQLNAWTDDEALPSPAGLAEEERLAMALIAAPTPDAPDAKPKEAKTLWDTWLSWTRRPLVFGPLLAAAGFLLVFRSTLFPPPEVLTCKGQAKCAPALQTQALVLHLGVWSPSKKKLRRIPHKGACTPKHNVSFGFTLRKNAGYLYLFVGKSKGKVELLLSPKDTKNKRWKVGFSDLKLGGQTQYYHMGKERGPVRFVLLKASRLLSASDLSALQRAKATALLGAVARLQHKLASKAPLIATHATLYVKAAQ